MILTIIKEKGIFLLALAFISGFAIMVMEISASRLLAPYFGTSIFVWTNIIGVVLIALSLGYYYGGKLADRIPEIDLLLKLILSAGVLFLIIPIIIKPLSSVVNLETLGFESSSIIIFVSSLILAAILFALPLFLLGMVSPFIIKLYLLKKGNQVGELAGRISAVSTIGSIFGTFLSTLYFIPVLGTRTSINIFALILIILGSLGLKKTKFNSLALIVLLGIIYFFGRVQISNYSDTIFESESAYQYISVRQNSDGTKYLLINEGAGIQSVYNSQKILTGFYFDYFNVLPNFINSIKPKKILIIGLCGGTIAEQLSYFFPKEVEIDGVEIDPKIIDVAKKYFAVNTETTKIYNSDGRMFLQNNSKKYDLIIVDAYAQELYIPWTLTTKEFWSLVRDGLSSEGIIAINVNSVTPDSRLLKSISNTIASIFSDTYITRINNNGMNYILIAANRPLDFSNLNGLIKDKQLEDLALDFKELTKKVVYDKNYMILTDDRAPVEFMTDRMALDYWKKYRDKQDEKR